MVEKIIFFAEGAKKEGIGKTICRDFTPKRPTVSTATG
jgi:hypothetical protein